MRMKIFVSEICSFQSRDLRIVCLPRYFGANCLLRKTVSWTQVLQGDKHFLSDLVELEVIFQSGNSSESAHQETGRADLLL